jgi:hypothetical protein
LAILWQRPGSAMPAQPDSSMAVKNRESALAPGIVKLPKSDPGRPNMRSLEQYPNGCCSSRLLAAATRARRRTGRHGLP